MDQSIGVFKFFFCLPWKSHDHICPDGEFWYPQMEFLDEIREEETAIVSIHLFQYLIVSALDGDVKVGADLI